VVPEPRPPTDEALDAAQINLPAVLAEVRALFASYEEALRRNDHAALDSYFWPSADAVRHGLAELSYGIDAIRRDRRGAEPVPADRRLRNTVVATFGRNAASVCTEFTSPGSPLIGRQTQTWIRFPSGWKIVAAHVSRIAAPGAAR
jgi:hypothetical protein